MKFEMGKFGLRHDPRGAQVTMQHQGRTLLGDVVGAEYNHVLGSILLDVRHFNGEPWPIKPRCLAVDVLEREGTVT